MNKSILTEEQEIIIIEPEDLLIASPEEVIDLTIIASDDFDYFEKMVLYYSNQERLRQNLHPLVPNPDLAKSALNHTIDMVENHFISHTGSDGSNVYERVKKVSRDPWYVVGENLAMGHQSPQNVVEGWMNSPGHRKNLLHPKYREIGIAYIRSKVYPSNGAIYVGGYWTQNFGARIGYRPNKQELYEATQYPDKDIFDEISIID